MNEMIKESKKETLSKWDKELKELEASSAYTPKITELIMSELVLNIKYKAVEEIYDENYITKENKEKLINKILLQKSQIKVDKSDLAKEAISNGCSRRKFEKYIIN